MTCALSARGHYPLDLIVGRVAILHMRRGTATPCGHRLEHQRRALSTEDRTLRQTKSETPLRPELLLDALMVGPSVLRFSRLCALRVLSGPL